MTMKRQLPSLLLLLLAFAATAVSCPLEGSLVLIPGDEAAEPLLLLQQSLDTANSSLTIEMTYRGQAWLSFGYNRDGRMVGSTVVVGFPDEEEASHYYLGAKDMQGIQAVADRQANVPIPTLAPTQKPRFVPPPPDSSQGSILSNRPEPGDWRRQLEQGQEARDDRVLTIIDSVVEQNDTHTILRFTRPLQEDNETVAVAVHPDSLNTFIYAVGRSNTFAFHQYYGSQTIDFAACDAIDNGKNATWMESNISFVASLSADRKSAKIDLNKDQAPVDAYESDITGSDSSGARQAFSYLFVVLSVAFCTHAVAGRSF